MHLHKSQEHVLKERLLAEFVRRRSRGETLQYIIGNQPFGDLEILCRVGVLIPRPETETYTQNLASLLKQLQQAGKWEQSNLKVLDLCTGTGCIAFLLYGLLFCPVTNKGVGGASLQLQASVFHSS